MDTSKAKIHYKIKIFFDKGENASQTTENINGVYGPDTIHAQFCRFVSVILMSKKHNALKDQLTTISMK